VLVAGAAGALGLRIAARLAARSDLVVAGYRTEKPEAIARLKELGCAPIRLDLADVADAAKAIADAEAAVLTPILTVSGPAARAALGRGARRVVLFSSNNVAIDRESPVYAALRAEEAALGSAPGDWTLVRPTMIYGHEADGNMSRLLRLAARLPALPLPGEGRALQQPIHVDDLADLAVALLDTPPRERVVSAAGPEPMTLRALYEAAARTTGRGRVVSLPLGPLRAVAGLARGLGLPFPLDAKQLARIDLDKTPRDAAPLADWSPRVGVDEGLARLAWTLGLPPSS
jgi:nucleoside-diphosphate-sugar epimerase